MKTEELKSKIITQLRFHRVSGKHENLTADHIIDIMQSNPLDIPLHLSS